MKWLRLCVFTALLAALVAPGAAFAKPAAPTAFTISPSPAFPGETVTFTVSIFGMGTSGTYRLCFYSNGTSGQTYTFPATIVAMDTWVLQAGSTGCFGPGFRARYETNTNNGGFFGDTLTFNVGVSGPAPTSTVTEAWVVMQYDGTTQLPPSLPANVQWLVASTVYVANDTTTCGSNTPCLTGTGALNRAIDGVTDPAGAGSPGVVTVLGTYNLGGSATADLTTAKEVAVNGSSGASIVNSSACANAMLSNGNAGAVLSVQNLTLNGTCVSGQRTAGVLTTAGSTNIRNVSVQNFAGSANVGIQAGGGTTVVEGSTFSGNQTALDGNGGILYAFANNVTTNLGLDAARNIDTGDNVSCNYWSSYNVSGSVGAVQFEERLGSPVSTYIEGTGALTLGRASLAAGTGNRVIVDLSRNTSTPPFGNGTVIGLGSLTSNFFAVCLARDGTVRGDLTIAADNVTPGLLGHRLYYITNTADCSPSTNTACWDYTGQSSMTAGAALTDTMGNAGHYVIGNQVDPTAIVISNFTASGSATANSAWLILLGTASMLAGVWLWQRRRHQIR